MSLLVERSQASKVGERKPHVIYGKAEFKRPVVVFDVDGVLVDNTERLQKSLEEVGASSVEELEGVKRRRFWDVFLSEKYLHLDKPVEEAKRLLRERRQQYDIVIVTGRPERLARATIEQLRSFGVEFDSIVFRDNSYRGKDYEYKAKALEDLKAAVAEFHDDSPDVIEHVAVNIAKGGVFYWYKPGRYSFIPPAVVFINGKPVRLLDIDRIDLPAMGSTYVIEYMYRSFTVHNAEDAMKILTYIRDNVQEILNNLKNMESIDDAEGRVKINNRIYPTALTHKLIDFDAIFSEDIRRMLVEQKPGSLYEFAEKHGFYIDKAIADTIDKVLNMSERKAFLLTGPAGVGKTHLTQLVADYLDARYVFYQCMLGTSEDDLLYKYVPSEETRSGIRITYGPLPRALMLSKNSKVVLVLDEFDKTRPSADALLLDMLQNFRVSLYLDDSETTVAGNPDNLVIFLTSNDMREFSEPLLRRVAVISLSHLPPEKIFEILLHHELKKETAMLLTQIYADTVNAGLRKPATVQELLQLGKIIEAGTSLSLEELLRMFVIKYDDDYARFISYLPMRKQYSNLLQKIEKKGGNIQKHYEPPEGLSSAEIKKKTEEAKKSENVQELLAKLSRIVVRFEEKRAEPVQVASKEDIEVSLKIPDKDFDAYTHVVKEFAPKPSDDPARLGKFEFVSEVVKVNEKEMKHNFVIAREPLKVVEASKLLKLESVEAYYEDNIYITDEDLHNQIIDKASKVKYYTNNKIYIEFLDGTIEEKVELERLSEISFRVRGYIKKLKKDAYSQLLAKIFDYTTMNADRLVYLLCRKLSISIRIDPEDLVGSYHRTDHISINDIITILENLRKSNIANNIFFSIGSNYNFYIDIDSNTITVNIGYELAKIIKSKLSIESNHKYKISDEIIDKVISVLREAETR